MKDKESINKNRLWNLREVVRALGGTNAAAEALGRNVSQITDICGPHPKRNIGNKLAGDIENKLGLPPGSLDSPAPKEALSEDPYISKTAASMANIPEEDKALILAMAEWVSSRSIRRSVEATSSGQFNLQHIAERISDYPLHCIEKIEVADKNHASVIEKSNP